MAETVIVTTGTIIGRRMVIVGTMNTPGNDTLTKGGQWMTGTATQETGGMTGTTWMTSTTEMTHTAVAQPEAIEDLRCIGEAGTLGDRTIMGKLETMVIIVIDRDTSAGIQGTNVTALGHGHLSSAT